MNIFLKTVFVRNLPKRSFHGGNILRIKEKGPLDGIRICDMSRVLAGPYCTMILGDLGAEVIKIEKPGSGDDTRMFGPPFLADQSYYFLSINRNKKSIAVDMTTKEGLDIIHQIAKKCDVFLENYLPGKLQSLGLGYNDLRAINPRLIYCSLTGYGNRGPEMNRPGYDLTISAIGGGHHLTGEEDGRSSRIGIATTDILTGMFTHSAIIAALFERLKTGKGKKLNVSLLHSQIASLHSVGTNYLNANQEAKRMGTAHPSIAPYQAFHAKDGGIFVVAATNDQHFKNLCLALDIPELLEDDRFLDNTQRVLHRKALENILQQIFSRYPANDWVQLLELFNIPCGLVNSINETFEKENNAERFVQELSHRVYGKVKVPGPPVEYNGRNRFSGQSAAPQLGEDTVGVLKNLLNMSDENISSLLRQNVVQQCIVADE